MFVRFNVHFWTMVWRIRSAFITFLVVMFAAAGVIAYTESIVFGDALYFAFVTGLTIGYGDIAPATAGGRVVSVLLGFVGVLFTGVVVGLAVRAVREAWAELHDAS